MYLKHLEINSNSVIVIDFEDGKQEPYFINRKSVGNVTGATMLLGRKLNEIVLNPSLYPNSEDRFYIENEEVKGKNEGVKGYRRLIESEKKEWIEKISKIEHLKDLKEIISKS